MIYSFTGTWHRMNQSDRHQNGLTSKYKIEFLKKTN